MKPSEARPAGKGAERHPIVWQEILVKRETSVESSGALALEQIRLRGQCRLLTVVICGKEWQWDSEPVSYLCVMPFRCIQICSTPAPDYSNILADLNFNGAVKAAEFKMSWPPGPVNAFPNTFPIFH